MEVNDTMILTVIHKEKKEKDYRMIIVPSGKSKIGIGQMKDYGIISYLGKGEEEKIGELGRAKLENIAHPVLKKTAECIKEHRLAGYQENMLKELLFDIENREIYD